MWPALLLLGLVGIVAARGKKSAAEPPAGAPPPPPGGAPPPAAGARLPWNVRSDATRDAQGRVNAVLRANGFETIAEDGILGPKTCAAMRLVADQLGRADLSPSALGADCQSFGTAPVRRGAAGVGTTAVGGGVAGGAGGPLPWMKFDARTREYQNRINAVLVLGQYQPIAADGILGPQTCAAGRFMANHADPNLAVPGLAPSANNADCQSFGTPPAKITGSGAGSQLVAANVFNLALASADPALMRRAATQLRAGGFDGFANSLESIADQLEAERAAA